MHLMASLGMDTSDYEQSIEEAKEQTKSSVASMTKDYNRLYSDVLHLTAAYQKSSKETGENSKATKDLKQKLSDAQKQLDATAKGLNTAQQYMDSFSKKTDTAGNSLASAMTKAQLLASAVQTAARKIKDLAVGFVQTGMQYNTQIETYRTALTNMLGDAEKANAMLTSIKRDAARTPFSTDALVAANQYLLSAGENAEYSQKTILALGDAIKATGGGDDELNRMAQNLQQVANVGKASAVDIKQFAFAGINIYQVLADYTGKSVQEVQSMTVTYDVLTKALQAAAQEGGRYYNSMATQSQTLEGRTTTLTDNVKQLAGELTTGLSSAYGSIVEKANSWVSSILESDEKLSKLETTVTVAASAVAGLTAAFVAYKAAMAIANIISAVQSATEGMTVAQAALNAVMAANPVALVVTALAALAGGLAAAYAANETFREGWNSAWSSIKDKFSTVADFILDKLNRIMGVANGVANAIAAIGRGENPLDAYNSAYNQSRQDYKGNKTQQRQREGGHARRTSNGGMWSDRGSTTASPVVSSIIATPTATGKKSTGKKSTTETVISSISSTDTTTAQNALGTVTTSIQTLTEKVKDSAGKIKDRITETTTTTGKEMVNGVATTFKQVETKVNGTVTKVTKTYDDMSKTLLGTLVATATKLVDGVSTVTQQTTEKYADGSEHIKQIITETGQHIVNGALETYTRVKTIVDGHETDTKETTEAVVSQYDTLLSAYGSAGKQVQELTTLYNESAETTGLDSEQTKRLSAMLADAEEAYASAGKELQEYEKKTDRARVVTKNFADLLKKSNSAFADFGGSISELGEFFGSDSIQGVGEFFTEITDGVDKVINLATSTATLVETLQQLSTTLQSIKAAGGVSTLLSGAGKLLGIGGTAAATGAAGTAATGAAATGAAGSGLAALGISVPEIGMILLAVLGVGAVGYGIYKLVTKNKEKDTVSSAMSYKDLQDAYWYGNERAFAGYDYRTDPYTFNPNNSAVLGYQAKMQEQMARLTEVVQQYLPDVANQQIVLDDGTLVGKMAPGMNAELGQMQILSERGN